MLSLIPFLPIPICLVKIVILARCSRSQARLRSDVVSATAKVVAVEAVLAHGSVNLFVLRDVICRHRRRSLLRSRPVVYIRLRFKPLIKHINIVLTLPLLKLLRLLFNILPLFLPLALLLCYSLPLLTLLLLRLLFLICPLPRPNPVF